METRLLLGLPLVLSAALAGCSFAPDYQRPSMPLPAAWQGMETPSTATDTPLGADWWKRYGSAELVRSIDGALKQNNDLQAALHRIGQARAQTRVSGAGLWPSVRATGLASRDDKGDSSLAVLHGYSGVFAVGYEVDIWQRNRNTLAAAEARLASTEFDRDALRLVVMADTAKFYFQVLNLSQRRQIARDNLALARNVLAMVEARFQEGASSGLEVAQQKTALANAEAALASLERQQILAENSLAVLRGQPPQNTTLKGESLRGLVLPELAPGQPAALLERRPDIRRQEAELIAANADIGIARAAFFPQLTLNLDAVLASTHPGTAATVLAAALVSPVFQGARLQGELARSEERQAELVENYRQTVLVSLREVEDALATIKLASQRCAALETAAEQARSAYRISRERYEAGAVDFLTVLDTQRVQLQAEDNLAQVQLEQMAASVDLFKALGGGWHTPVADPQS